jgi:hypothetical protein
VILTDTGPQPQVPNDYSFFFNIEYIEMPDEDLKEFEEIMAFEESLKPKEGQELSDIAKSFEMLVEIPGEIPSQTIQRV